MLNINNTQLYIPNDRELKKLNFNRKYNIFNRVVKLNDTIYFAKPTDIQCYINAKVYEKLAEVINLECCPTLLLKISKNEYEQLSQSLFSLKKGKFNFVDTILENNDIINSEKLCLIRRNEIIHEKFNGRGLVDIGLQSLYSQFPSVNKTDYIKMIVADLYTNQKDRHGHNMQMNIKSGNLAPLYDNDLCLLGKDFWPYFDENDNQIEIYSNPLIVVKRTEQGFSDFLDKYPEAAKYFKLLLETDFKSIINDIIIEDKLKSLRKEFDFEQYLIEEDDIKKRLKTLL